MVRMFVRHDVADYDAWRQGYDAFDSTRRSLGVTGQAVYQSIDNPNDVTVWHDFASAEEAKALVSSDELRAAMEQAGVTSKPSIWITQAS